jgi:hypothetical protein
VGEKQFHKVGGFVGEHWWFNNMILGHSDADTTAKDVKPEPAGDPTNPHHYTRLNPQPIDVISNWGLDFDTGCAIKYLARAGKKDSTKEVEDLQKAIVYIQHRIKVVQTRNE